MTGRKSSNMSIIAAAAVFALLATACSGDDEPETAPATTPAPAPTTAAPPPPTSPPTTEAAAVELSACEQFFVTLDALSGEFVQLVDDGNRSLLLTIGLETPYDVGAEELGGIAQRLNEISTEIAGLGEPPTELEGRVKIVIQAIDQFAVGYAAGAEAAAVPDVVALNQSLATVSQGTGLLRAASETPAQCL